MVALNCRVCIFEIVVFCGFVIEIVVISISVAEIVAFRGFVVEIAVFSVIVAEIVVSCYTRVDCANDALFKQRHL